jgi:hypothetical protein
VTYGGGGEVTLQPGGDARGEVLGVGGGEEEAGVVAAQADEDVDGCAVNFSVWRTWSWVTPATGCPSGWFLPGIRDWEGAR